MIDASGHTGLSGTTQGKAVSAYRDGSAGGDIRIGGDYLGQGNTPTAQNLYVDSGALILNDSLFTGDAGRTIFWSDGTTQFYGNIYARSLGGLGVDTITWGATPGGNVGDGGFVETSGHNHLDAGGYVNLTASSGEKGTYFLDPTDITIYGNVDPAFQSTDGSINLATSLKLWLDASDTSKVTLTYSMDGLAGATATGATGSNTITTSADVSANLAVGARIRLGSAGSVTTADTVGADTYTITAISGTTITLSGNLTQSYSGSALHRGLVSQLADKAGQGADLTQSNAANMPLWVSGAINGRASVRYDGNDILVRTGLQSDNLLSSTESSVMLVQQAANQNQFSFFYGDDMPNRYSLAAPWGGTTVYYDTVGCCSSSEGRYEANASLIGVMSAQIGTRNGSTATLYVDGRSLGTQPVGYSYPTGVTSTLHVGGYLLHTNLYRLVGDLPEIGFYSAGQLPASADLLQQYQSAKWGIALTPPGTGATEVSKATASDGYSAFTTRYLERLSQSANISLQATNNINLDLKGDTLALASNRDLTLTAGNQITTASAGAITTNNGNTSLNATNGILLNHAYTLNSQGGNITLNNATTLGGALTVNAGTGTFTSAGTIAAGANDLTVTADDVAIGSNLSGTGILSFSAFSAGRRIDLNHAADYFSLTQTEISRIQPGWSLVRFLGAATGSQIYMTDTSWSNSLDITGSYFRLGGTTTLNNAASITSSAYTEFTGPVNGSGGGLAFSGTTVSGLTTTIQTGGGGIQIANLQLIQGLSATTNGGTIQISGTASTHPAFTTGTLSLDAGSGVVSLQNIDGPLDLVATGRSLILGASLGGTTPLAAVSLTSTNSLTLPSISASSVLARTTGGSSDLTLAAGKTITGSASGTAITLAAGRNFVNNAGAGALSVPSGRWLVYSSNLAETRPGGLSADFYLKSCNYGGSCPTIPGTGNGFLYRSSVAVSATTASEATRILFAHQRQKLATPGQSEPGYTKPSGNEKSPPAAPDANPQDLAPAEGQQTEDQSALISVDPEAQKIFDLPPVL